MQIALKEAFSATMFFSK